MLRNSQPIWRSSQWAPAGWCAAEAGCQGWVGQDGLRLLISARRAPLPYLASDSVGQVKAGLAYVQEKFGIPRATKGGSRPKALRRVLRE
jgi:hypothetical protein